MAWTNIAQDYITGSSTNYDYCETTINNANAPRPSGFSFTASFNVSSMTYQQLNNYYLYGDNTYGIQIYDTRASGSQGAEGYLRIYSNGVQIDNVTSARITFKNSSGRAYALCLYCFVNEETQKGTIIFDNMNIATGDNPQRFCNISTCNTSAIYTFLKHLAPVLYTWQSVPSISGKNGILSLYELAQETDGNPVTGASSSVFFSMPEECNVKKLYPNIVYGQEQIIAYSGINELSVRWDSATEAFFRFTIYDQEGEYDWSYGYSFSLNNASDKLYIMLLVDVREDQTRLLRPSFVIKDGVTGEYSYNLETVSDENAERLYGWFVMNYDGVSIFGPPNEPAGGSGSLPLNDEPVGRPTLNNNRNAINTGFTRMYWLTDASKLNDFASWMSDPDRIWDKIFETDPLQGIIEVALCPVYFFSNDDLFSTNIRIFGQDTGIAAYRLSSQFFRLECGTYTFETQCGDTYLDYAPYTTIKVFLPYIGIVELNTNDVMKREIKLEYTFDILWGVCIAHIFVKNDDDEWTLHYERHGQYLINIPITKADRGQEAAAIKQAITFIASAFGAAGGYALGGGNVSDMSPNAAAGTGAGILGGTVSTALNVVSSHPQISYSDGSVGGLSGYMGVDEPFIMIEHVITARPEHDELYTGMPCYITGDVGDFENYNKFVDVHLESIPCTKKEQDEIYSWLTNGVIIKTGSSTPDDEPVTEGNSLLIFLKMTSENNVIGKTFGDKKVLEGKLIYDTSIEEPKFLVDGDIRGYNYVYIPIFSRFYYIEDIVLRRQMLQEISMKVDVLQSFKTQIRACSGIPMRSGDSDKINYYINDGAIIAQQNTRVFTQKFRKNAAHFSFDKTGAGYLLTVADANLST